MACNGLVMVFGVFSGVFSGFYLLLIVFWRCLMVLGGFHCFLGGF